MFRRLMAGLSRQRSSGTLIGALINIYTSTAILYSPLTLMGVVTTVYGLWGNSWIQTYLPWFSIWHLFGLMMMFIIIMMVIFHKVVLPSIYAFQVQQQYKHKNPMVTDLKKIMKILSQIDQRLERLEHAKEVPSEEV